MRAARFAPPIRQRLRTRRAQVLKPSEETETKGPLPPLVRVQGPFKSPEKVWKQRNKPLNLSLTASTDYNSLEIARYDHLCTFPSYTYILPIQLFLLPRFISISVFYNDIPIALYSSNLLKLCPYIFL